MSTTSRHPAPHPGAASHGAPTPGQGLGTRQRTTRQGGAVLNALGATDAFCSAQDLHAELREQGVRIGLATVYRHLQVLVDDGEVDTTRNDDGEVLYRRCETTGHHHHLVCRTCGRTVEVAAPAVERWTEKVAAQHDYSDVEHTVEILGTCPQCRTNT